MKTIVCDIDHTLSNAAWRDSMIGVNSWDEYHSASIDDKPLHDVTDLIAKLHRLYDIVLVTARPERFRKLTMNWLLKHNIFVDEMLMRENENYLPAPELKRQMIEKHFQDPRSEIAFALEDREDVCEMFKGLGITVLQVHGRID